MKKGEAKKQAILEAGLDIASQVDLQGVSIGALAKATGMSKSGLFAHFQSKENLQIAILTYAEEQFRELVINPAMQAEEGIPRIRALVAFWIEWTSHLSGGCIFVTASNEFSDQPGKVRDNLKNRQILWEDTLSQIAQEAINVGAFRKDADCKQFAFELYSLLLGFQYYKRLLNDTQTKKCQEKALDRLIEYYS